MQIARKLVAAFDAGHPSRSGYRLVFDDEFNDARGISFNSSEDGPPGFRWYARLFDVWGGVTSAPEAFSTADGILTIAGGQLGTAAPARNARGFVGTTFANGAYFEARIAFDAATVRYPGDDRPALDRLSFEARPGEIVALLGDSGSGKTTALNLLLGLAPLTGGVVGVDAAPLSKAGGFGYPRLFIGKNEERESTVILRDAKGLARLKLTVTPAGVASIEFMDESGRIVRRIAEK